MAQVHYLSMCCLLVYTCKPQYNKNPIPFGIKKDNSGMCTCEENVWEPLVINFPEYALKTASDLIFIHINRHTYHAHSLHPKFSLNHSEDIYANYDFIIYVYIYIIYDFSITCKFISFCKIFIIQKMQSSFWLQEFSH